ncbi:MAG: hypothetical protein LH650_08715 [Chloroflexi bacterium]|nr:hypothetical protein [Chloroflexota bacterium]
MTYTLSSHVLVRSSANSGSTWGAAVDVSSYGYHSNVVIADGHSVVISDAPDEFSATTFETHSN